MAAFLLQNEQREHLKVIREQSSEAVVDFCKLAFEYLENGANEKKYVTVAKKYNIPTNQVQPAIEALVGLLINATKTNISGTEFEKLQLSGFSSEHVSILWQFVTSKRSLIKGVLDKTGVIEYRFRDLDWRLEVKVASKSALHQCIPLVTLKFYLDSENIIENRTTLRSNDDEAVQKNTGKQVLLQTDPNNLIHIIEVLEQALLELKIQRTRKITKMLQ